MVPRHNAAISHSQISRAVVPLKMEGSASRQGAQEVVWSLKSPL